MSNIRVDLDSVRVTNGQGVGEGNFELRIMVLEAVPVTGHVEKLVWPSLTTTRQVNNNGTPATIAQEVETYTVNSGKITKTFLVQVTEEDTGTLGQDEFGEHTIVFDLFPGMSRATGIAFINLNNRGNNEGQVLVTMSARCV